MVLERRDMCRGRGDGQEAAEHANEGPKYNHEGPQFRHWFTSMAEEVGQRVWIAMPSRMWDEPVEEDVDIDLYLPEVVEVHWPGKGIENNNKSERDPPMKRL